jgi:hypothetical protein
MSRQLLLEPVSTGFLFAGFSRIKSATRPFVYRVTQTPAANWISAKPDETITRFLPPNPPIHWPLLAFRGTLTQ